MQFYRHIASIFRAKWLCLLLLQGFVVGAWLGAVPVGLESEAQALAMGQRVRFWYYAGGHRITLEGQVLALSGGQVRVRYLSSEGQPLSRWVPRSQVIGLQGTGNLVYTCQSDSKIYTTRTGRRICCPPTATGYHTRSGGDVICCPGGTIGILSGQHHVLCRYGGGGGSGSVCPAGQTLYRAKSGKGYCCPPGTAGYYLGYDGITCRYSGAPSQGTPPPPSSDDQGGTVTCPPRYQAYIHRATQRRFCCAPGARGNTVTGQCIAPTASKCPPANDMGRTPESCVRYRGTTWKCSPFQLSDGTQCQRCNCRYP